MSVRRSARKAVDQSRLTEFFETSARPSRASSKKVILKNESLAEETLTISRPVKGTTKVRRDKITSSTTSLSSSSSSTVIRREIDFDYSPTKRPLPVEKQPKKAETPADCLPSSPPKKSRENDSDNNLSNKRQTRSAQAATPSKTITKTTTKMLQFEQSSVSENTEELLDDSQVRDKLKGCKNWLQIKQQLLTINNCAEKVKQFKQMKIKVNSPVKPKKLPPHLRNLSPEKLSVAHLSPFGNKWPQSPLRMTPTKSVKFSKNVHSKKSSSSCVKRLFDDEETGEECSSKTTAPVNDSNNNVSTPKDKEPAYKRFHHLVKPATPTKTVSDSDSGLTLPVLYKNLLDLFKTVDQLVWTHTKRHQLCTFKKLKQMVESYTRKPFEVDHLLKMQTVGLLEKVSWFKLSYVFHDSERQLCIASQFAEQVKCLNSVSMLLEREDHFHSILLDCVKKEHLKFLGSMDIRLDLEKKIFKWHPMFKLDSVPDIVPNKSLLPKDSVKDKNLDRNSILNYIVFKNDVESAGGLKKKAKKDGANDDQISVKREVKQETTVNSRVATTSSGKDDKFKALLEKVRAKEAAKLAKTMHRTPEIEQEIAMLGRLSEVIQIIYIQFSTSKAKSLPIGSIVKKISDSFTTSFEQTSVLKHLNYLLTLKLGYLPEFSKDFVAGQDNTQPWLKKVTVNGSEYLQMEAKVKLSQLLQQVQHRVHQLKS